jgi:hypothetical protein
MRLSVVSYPIHNSDPLLTIAPNTATVTILDDNEPECQMVTVGWENTAYTTTETEGTVTMCAIVMPLPLRRTVVVSADTQDITAIAGVDYDGINTVLTFVPGGPTRQCVMVPINQDEICEDDPNETFRGVLSNTNSDPLLTIAPISHHYNCYNTRWQ